MEQFLILLPSSLVLRGMGFTPNLTAQLNVHNAVVLCWKKTQFLKVTTTAVQSGVWSVFWGFNNPRSYEHYETYDLARIRNKSLETQRGYDDLTMGRTAYNLIRRERGKGPSAISADTLHAGDTQCNSEQNR
jgi:hypothetical protein